MSKLRSLVLTSQRVTTQDFVEMLRELREHFLFTYEKTFSWPELGSTKCIKAGDELLPLNHPNFRQFTAKFSGFRAQGIFTANPVPTDFETWIAGLDRHGQWVYAQIQTAKAEQGHIRPLNLAGAYYGRVEPLLEQVDGKVLVQAFVARLETWKKLTEERLRALNASIETVAGWAAHF